MTTRDKFQAWIAPPIETLDEAAAGDFIASQYEAGFSGVGLDAEERERHVYEFEASITEPDGAKICHELGYADSAKGQLVPTWEIAEKTYPGCWPASAQRRGDCVSHSGRNARLTTHCGEIVAGKPDEVSGKREGKVEVSEAGQRDGVFATEPHYRERGHRGDGWYCAADAKVAVTKAGAVVRKDYGFADLTRYNSKYAGGANSAAERDAFDNNLFRDGTRVSSFEEIRDLLARGFGISSCGSEGFAKTRDENGVAKRSGRWAHAMAYVGSDDRPKVVQKYGGPLVLILNSWGPSWIRGSKRVMDTDKEIPDGAFWARWSDIRSRDCYVLGGLNGWERETILDYVPAF